ncbi:MAG: hypothetical protein RL139_509 [Gemmatimonadota bacterium]|jgi:hypothetical protein
MIDRWREEMAREVRACASTLAALVAAEPAPDPGVLLATVRRLQGEAVLAHLEAVAPLAVVLERVAAASAAGRLAWEEPMRHAVRAAVDAFEMLGDGHPTPAQERDLRRAEARLLRLLPAPTPGEARGAGAQFLASQLEALVAALRHAAATDGLSPAVDDVVGTLATLRGVAAVWAIPTISETLDALDRRLTDTRRGGDAAGPVAGGLAAFLRAAAEVLAESVAPIAHGALPPTDSGPLDAFAEVLRGGAAVVPPSTPIVPIQSLLATDAASTLPARDPLRTRVRFHADATPLAEGLRHLVAESRRAQDVITRTRVTADLQATIDQLTALAESLAEPRIARVLRDARLGAHRLAPKALWVLDDVGALLSDPALRLADLDQAIAGLQARLDGPQPPPVTAPLARVRRATPPVGVDALPSIDAFLLPSTATD